MKLSIDPTINYTLLPDHLRGGMKRYLESGILPGGFLQACLRNDLSDAVLRADDETLPHLRDVVWFLNNEVPAPAWGSQKKTDEWVKRQQGPVQ